MASVGFAIDVGSGILVAALGVWVATRKPRRSWNALFAAFAVLSGALYVLQNLEGTELLLGLPLGAWALACGALGGASLLALLLTFPRRDITRSPRSLAIPALVLAYFTFVQVPWRVRLLLDEGEPMGVVLRLVGQTLFRGALLAGLVLLAARYARSARAGREREPRQVAVLAGALALHPALASGILVLAAEPSGYFVASFATMLLVAGAWLATAARSSTQAAPARNVAILVLGLMLAGMAISAVQGDPTVVENAGYAGVARTLAVLSLAYAILRLQLFDVDVKLKWTIRRGTLAAVFVGVFFAATELAGNVLSQRYGYAVGGVAAGLLLFAIAPLQRMAERVADRALPGVGDGPGDVMESKRRLYWDALAIAWEDGRLDPHEAKHLADLRDALRLPAEEYVSIERAWADKAA